VDVRDTLLHATVDLYSYTGGNPVSLVDPNGLRGYRGMPVGVFTYEIKNLNPMDKAEYPGCCSSAVDVIYKPSDAEKQTYFSICIYVAVYTKLWQQSCPFSRDRPYWHYDPPKDAQNCYCRTWFDRRPTDDNRIFTNGPPYWTDYPGINTPEEGDAACCIDFRPCSVRRLRQDFEACAVATRYDSTYEIRGCVRYGHDCVIRRTRESSWLGCRIRCSMSRYPLSKQTDVYGSWSMYLRNVFPYPSRLRP
jgi:hypothetical protein